MISLDDIDYYVNHNIAQDKKVLSCCTIACN